MANGPRASNGFPFPSIYSRSPSSQGHQDLFGCERTTFESKAKRARQSTGVKAFSPRLARLCPLDTHPLSLSFLSNANLPPVAMFASPASHHPHQNPLAAAANGQQQQQQQQQPAQPVPPPSLREILDAFGKDGNGDREMLMSILSSKRAEEEVRPSSDRIRPGTIRAIADRFPLSLSSASPRSSTTRRSSSCSPSSIRRSRPTHSSPSSSSSGSARLRLAHPPRAATSRCRRPLRRTIRSARPRRRRRRHPSRARQPATRPTPGRLAGPTHSPCRSTASTSGPRSRPASTRPPRPGGRGARRRPRRHPVQQRPSTAPSSSLWRRRPSQRLRCRATRACRRRRCRRRRRARSSSLSSGQR